ncbi:MULTISPECIES: SDR family NAD(P)-dependent oxidoreductase [unclassified Arthrobacter]|uniref:SDR family NAD(P)-dependent oxidoreductase n=1 Tax=unclassified Arthrobacter TaxID=235627 RepID=UPI0024E019ED|nr:MULTISPECIES: SDR family NAD(P)-dependent oxidoreductase [unclassified Arthrobacter]MCC9145253.1 SDR family NAD(P)-dependent oxidoreductase [Arthrobacter sp. zg-Y919]MDK1276481.1 SDR family NAD(P)-dependent oxidoreductase [Arthrobacter sp. zg.Y919]WIB01920.1 SDR family NAD(P)-dependent oxidoreductase [Arthrobacter sp. zg-Y919]
MSPKTIVITGASDGIGAAAARRLTQDGHHVVLVGRSPEKTAAVARDTGGEYFLADFADLGSVRTLASELLQRYPHIDVLANNAGAVFGNVRQVTEDGHEMTFQVNYLAPFLLTQLLTDRLLESKGTVINTSSMANRLFGNVDLDDLENENGYNPSKAYGNAKLEQILFTEEFDRRYRSHGATSTAFHPGVIGSSFSNAEGSAMRAVYQSPLLRRLLPTPEKGARTLVFLAEGTPGTDYPTGKYFVRSKVAKPNKQAGDAALALGLWNRSVAMLAE